MQRRRFSGNAVAYAMRGSPAYLRQLRALGALDGLGERDGNAMKYTAAEAIRIALGLEISRTAGFTVRRAFADIAERWPAIASHIFAEPQPARDLILEFEFVRTDDTERAQSHAAIFVNVTTFAADAVTRLREFADRERRAA